jgi:hypothetical protein
MSVRSAQLRRWAVGSFVTTILIGTSAFSSPHAVADDAPLHHVRYTLTTERPFHAEIYYRDVDPPSWADYSHDPYVFTPNAEADVGPDRPWILEAMLVDPQSWAMVVGTSGLSAQPPEFHCTLEVDGVVAATNSGPKGALCSVRPW